MRTVPTPSTCLTESCDVDGDGEDEDPPPQAASATVRATARTVSAMTFMPSRTPAAPAAFPSVLLAPGRRLAADDVRELRQGDVRVREVQAPARVGHRVERGRAADRRDLEHVRAAGRRALRAV